MVAHEGHRAYSGRVSSFDFSVGVVVVAEVLAFRLFFWCDFISVERLDGQPNSFNKLARPQTRRAYIPPWDAALGIDVYWFVD